jgi:pyruvate kinase
MTLEVVAKTKRAIKTRVITTGILGSNKGINLKDGGLTAPSFTEKDARDLDFAIEQDVDFVALSFVKNANDVFSVREKITQSKKYIQVISKIERSDALKYIDEIAKVSHGLMIARGDLALEIGFAKVPAVQKQIIKVGKQNNNFVIVATQMMESMITNNHPTRAEVSDVANAILDHADALMLSAETAMGVHPDHVVQSMNEICLETESHVKYLKLERQLQPDTKNVSMVIADQAIQVGHVLGAKAVVIFTEFGATVQYASRHDSKIPIFGMSRINKTCQRTQIYRGVTPIGVRYDRLDYENINIMAAKHLRPIIDFNDEDLVVIVKGDMIGVTGHTNSLEVWSANMLLGDMSVSQQYEESDC